GRWAPGKLEPESASRRPCSVHIQNGATFEALAAAPCGRLTAEVFGDGTLSVLSVSTLVLSFGNEFYQDVALTSASGNNLGPIIKLLKWNTLAGGHTLHFFEGLAPKPLDLVNVTPDSVCITQYATAFVRKRKHLVGAPQILLGIAGELLESR